MFRKLRPEHCITIYCTCIMVAHLKLFAGLRGSLIDLFLGRGVEARDTTRGKRGTGVNIFLELYS
jgi:hypothetical protein